MIGLLIALVLVAMVVVLCAFRMWTGPDDANRAVASDLLFFCVIALFAIIGSLLMLRQMFDIVLIATVVGFLASISLARAITRGRR